MDECALGSHACNHDCVNTNGSYFCSCYAGYQATSNQKYCIGQLVLKSTLIIDALFTDTNECAINNGGCDQLCANTQGSYWCSCNNGYVLNATDGHTCIGKLCMHQTLRFHHTSTLSIDINECADGTAFCEDSCFNTDGSYACDCKPGYQLLMNNISCSDINECIDNNGGCDHECINQEGSYICICDTGFTIEEDGQGCSSCQNIYIFVIHYFDR